MIYCRVGTYMYKIFLINIMSYDTPGIIIVLGRQVVDTVMIKESTSYQIENYLDILMLKTYIMTVDCYYYRMENDNNIRMLARINRVATRI